MAFIIQAWIFCLLILVINFFFRAWGINNILIVIFPLVFVPLNTSNCKYAGHTGFNCNNLYICPLWRVPVHKDFSGCYAIGQTVTCSRNGIFEELQTWSSFGACEPLTFTVTTAVELLAVKAGAELKRGGWKFATNPGLLSKSQQIFLNNAQYLSSWLISRFLKKIYIFPFQTSRKSGQYIYLIREEEAEAQAHISNDTNDIVLCHIIFFFFM